VLDHFASKREIRTLLTLEPNWDLLLNETHVQKLFHVHRHASLLAQVKPRTVTDLADCLALIRPRKKRLLTAYLTNKEKTRPLLYQREQGDKTSFKRSHSIAYSLTIVLQLHLIELGVM
jgi:hypothetical protein